MSCHKITLCALRESSSFLSFTASVSAAAAAAAAAVMALRMVLHGIRSVARKKATTQEVSSCLLSPRRINHQTSNIFSNHHHNRQCHHDVRDDTTAHKPRSTLDHDDKLDGECEYDCFTGISHYSHFSDSDADEAYPYDEDSSYYEDCVVDSARFAVNFHNLEQNAQLQFVRILRADYFLVAGSMLYITLEVNDASKSDFYRTKVYYKPWDKKREVIAWERVEEAPPFRSQREINKIWLMKTLLSMKRAGYPMSSQDRVKMEIEAEDNVYQASEQTQHEHEELKMN